MLHWRTIVQLITPFRKEELEVVQGYLIEAKAIVSPEIVLQNKPNTSSQKASMAKTVSSSGAPGGKAVRQTPGRVQALETGLEFVQPPEMDYRMGRPKAYNQVDL